MLGILGTSLPTVIAVFKLPPRFTVKHVNCKIMLLVKKNYICVHTIRATMKLKILFVFVLFLSGAVAFGKGLAKFDKARFYEVIKTGNKENIDELLALLASSDIIEKDAYEGFLLMRKAGITARPAEKLKLFKSGRIKLETAMVNDNTNAEYHFLRLIIQEKAPKIVKYNKDQEADRQIVTKEYKNLPAVVQHAIADYAKTSKILKLQDLN